MQPNNRLEPVLILLALMILMFTALLFVCAKFIPMDGQTFQVVSGLLTGFSGAFLMRVTPKKTADEVAADSMQVRHAETTKTLVTESAPPDQPKQPKES